MTPDTHRAADPDVDTLNETDAYDDIRDHQLDNSPADRQGAIKNHAATNSNTAAATPRLVSEEPLISQVRATVGDAADSTESATPIGAHRAGRVTELSPGDPWLVALDNLRRAEKLIMDAGMMLPRIDWAGEALTIGHRCGVLARKVSDD